MSTPANTVDTANTKPVQLIDLVVEPISAAAFAPYGTLIEATEDGKPFGPDEAQLDLNRGTPRFYVMRLHRRELAFRHLTRHLAVTQCLAAVGGQPWLMAVAVPTDPDDPSARADPASIRAFSIPGNVAVAMHRSTWHVGPYFDADSLDFFNLELADTNIVDHHNCRLDEHFGLAYRLVMPSPPAA